MGLADAFGKEETVNIKLTELETLIERRVRCEEDNKLIINGLENGVKKRDILAMLGKLKKESEDK